MNTSNYDKKAAEFNRRKQCHDKVLELYRNASETFERVSAMKYKGKDIADLNGVDSLFAIKEAGWAHLVWFFELLNNYEPFHRGTILEIAKKRGYKPHDRKAIQKHFVQACDNLDLVFQGKGEE